jgi:phage FluMu protein Com
VEIPVNGELPVYPMTARDEITLRTPDALLNGQGVVDVIQSCCPNIKNAWRMPSVDVDATLIALRIASYGPGMDLTSKCPKCSETNEFTINLNTVLDGIRMPSYTEKIDCGHIKVKVRPQEYFSANQTEQIRFEEQRIISTLTNESLSDEQRIAEYSKHMERIVGLNLKVLCDSTEYIETADSDIVNNPEYILEFYNNCESSLITKIQEKLAGLSAEAKIKPIDVECEFCKDPYLLPIMFNYSSFFAKGS